MARAAVMHAGDAHENPPGVNGRVSFPNVIRGPGLKRAATNDNSTESKFRLSGVRLDRPPDGARRLRRRPITLTSSRCAGPRTATIVGCGPNASDGKWFLGKSQGSGEVAGLGGFR
jgi:hypothetical protein